MIATIFKATLFVIFSLFALLFLQIFVGTVYENMTDGVVQIKTYRIINTVTFCLWLLLNFVGFKNFIISSKN